MKQSICQSEHWWTTCPGPYNTETTFKIFSLRPCQINRAVSVRAVGGRDGPRPGPASALRRFSKWRQAHSERTRLQFIVSPGMSPSSTQLRN